jgi:hypothetical protein
MKCNAHICCLYFITSNPGILQEPRRIWYAVLVAAEGVPQDDLLPQPVEDDREAVAAADEVPVLVGERWPRRGESRGRDAVWRVQSRVEDGVSASNP